MKLELTSLDLLGDSAAHNAFTDLIFFENNWWCAYRSASGHMSYDGQITILSTKDGVEWIVFDVVSWAGGDLRDPKFYLSPKGELCLMVGVRLAVYPYLNARVFSINWPVQHPEKIANNMEEGTWRWSASNLNRKLYSVGYTAKDILGCLYSSEDGAFWEPVKAPFFPESDCFSNESSLVYSEKDRQAYCLLRRDGKKCSALLGSSQPPFTQWKWTELYCAMGGPKLLLTQKNRLIVAYRRFIYEKDEIVDAEMVISLICKRSDTTEELIVLPSEGDCSYAGMVEKDEALWVSYYSSHEGSSKVYLAKLRIY